MTHRFLCLFIAFFIWVPNTSSLLAFPYRIKKGDNFQSLAKRFSFIDSEKKIKITISPQQIAKANRGKKWKPLNIIEIPIKDHLLFPYYIERGETLISLSLKTGVPVKVIRRWLGNLPLYAGRDLYLPLIEEHFKKNKQQKKTTPVSKIATPVSINLGQVRVNQDQIEQSEEKKSNNKKSGWRRVIDGNLSHIIAMAKKSEVNFFLPPHLSIINPYGVTNDILQSSVAYQADKNHIVYAAEKGVVDFSQTLRGLGHTIIIVHQGGFHSLYAGLKKPLKNHGDFVSRKEALGEVDNNFTFALYYRGIPFDPIKYQSLVDEK